MRGRGGCAPGQRGQSRKPGPLSNPWRRLGAVLSWDWVLSRPLDALAECGTEVMARTLPPKSHGHVYPSASLPPYP